MGTSFRLSADKKEELQRIALAISGGQNTEWGFSHEAPAERRRDPAPQPSRK